MITNNQIREYLGEETSEYTFPIYCVDALGDNCRTLMFINKSGVDLSALDHNCRDSVFLVDSDIYERYISDINNCNDFIMVKNPKFLFSLLVREFDLKSKLQIEHNIRSSNYPNFAINHAESLYCDECMIGYGCRIDKGAIIGGTDFSPVLGDSPMDLHQFPQLGGVMIGTDVVIKYNTMIGKGTFGYTEIGHNTMIDFGCQIGHNCKIGKSCIIAAGTIIGGSTTVGDGTVIGIGAKIRNGIKIGANASIGMGAVVIRDVPANAVVVGNPARIIDHKKIFDEKGLV